jgi:hypothetical protein
MKKLITLLFGLAMVSGCAVSTEASDETTTEYACDSAPTSKSVADACEAGFDAQRRGKRCKNVCCYIGTNGPVNCACCG